LVAGSAANAHRFDAAFLQHRLQLSTIELVEGGREKGRFDARRPWTALGKLRVSPDISAAFPAALRAMKLLIAILALNEKSKGVEPIGAARKSRWLSKDRGCT